MTKVIDYIYYMKYATRPLLNHRWYLLTVSRKLNQNEMKKRKHIKARVGCILSLLVFCHSNSFWFLFLLTVNKYHLRLDFSKLLTRPKVFQMIVLPTLCEGTCAHSCSLLYRVQLKVI